MKSTIATILGTATLGLIKSKMGSGLRLKNSCYSFTQAGMEIPSSDKDKVLKLIKELEPMMNENGIFIFELDFDEGNEQDETVVIILGLQKPIDSDEELRRCNIWLSGEDPIEINSRFEYWILGDTSKKIDDFWDEAITPQIEKITTILEWVGDYSDYGYEQIIVNADTGEVYEPSLPSTSKLRKR